MNPGERILDAALDESLSFGIKGLSIDRVARRVGVSRATVYRHFANKEALVAAMVERETLRVLARVGAVLKPHATIHDHIVEGFAATIHLAREHPLLQKILSSEPESAARFVDGDTNVLATVRHHLASVIRHHRPRADADTIAEVIVRVGATFLFLQDGIKLSTASEARSFARRFLAPMIDEVPPTHS